MLILKKEFKDKILDGIKTKTIRGSKHLKAGNSTDFRVGTSRFSFEVIEGYKIKCLEVIELNVFKGKDENNNLVFLYK